MTAALFTCAALFFGLALHPFSTYPLSLWLLSKVIRRPIVASVTARSPTVSICVCAYNEERVIEAKLENLLRLRARMPSLEVLLYVDCASDRTAEIAGRYADRIHLHVADQRRGKTHGMNLLVGKSSGDIVVFTDANVMLADDALIQLLPHFDDANIGCVCGTLTYTNAGDSATAFNGSLYWRLEERIKLLETKVGSVMGADGSIFAIRRSLHVRPPDHIIDDMFVSFNVLCQGYRIVQATDVRAFEESAPAMRDEFRRKIRIACQAFNVHRLLTPQLRALDALSQYQYLSHKLLRWFAIYLLGAAGLFFELALCIAGFPLPAAELMAAAWAMVAAGYYWKHGPIRSVVDILIAFLATGIGIWRSFRGEQFQTWTPVASLRK